MCVRRALRIVIKMINYQIVPVRWELDVELKQEGRNG